MWKQAQLEQWQKTNAEYNNKAGNFLENNAQYMNKTQEVEKDEEEESSGEEYEDEYEDEDEDEDDEYAPIEMAAWGSQSVSANGTTNVNIPASSWESLIDPNFKVSGNGLGSGQLHRKGNNFIPLAEQMIVNQRLGKPLPKAVGGKKKKKKSKSGAKPPPPSKPAPRPFKSSYIPPPVFSPTPSSIANRSRAEITTGPWASGNLSSVPFWESSNASKAPQQANPPATTNSSMVNQRPPRPQTIQQTQKSTPMQTTNQYNQPPGLNKQPSHPPGLNQQPTRPPGLNQPPAQMSAPPGLNKPPTQMNPPPGFGQMTSPPGFGQSSTRMAPPPGFSQLPAPTRSSFDFQVGTAASKYAPFNIKRAAEAAAASIYQQQQPVYNQPPTQQQPIQNNIPSPQPIINFDIELSPGIHAKLPIYENDNPVDVVNQFEKKHHLSMSDAAKAAFASKVEKLMENYRS